MAAKKKQQSLRQQAANTAAREGDRRMICVVDTIPGLRDDLAATIADQTAKPLEERHSIRALYDMACTIYPDLGDRLSYNGFWKYVGKTFGYHGTSRRARRE